jgi:hypothetical protein
MSCVKSPLTLEPPPIRLEPPPISCSRSEPLASLSIAKIEAGFRILTNSNDNVSFSVPTVVVAVAVILSL